MKLTNEKLTKLLLALSLFAVVLMLFILVQQTKIQHNSITMQKFIDELSIQQVQIDEMYKQQDTLRYKLNNLKLDKLK